MNATRRPLRSQFVWVLSGRVAAALLQAALMLLLARTVSPAEFGFFAAPYGVATVVQTVFDLGLPSLAVKRRSRDAGDGQVTTLLHLNSRLSLAMALAMLVVTVVLGFLVDDRYFFLLPLSLWAAAERNADAWLGVALADGDVWVNMCNLVARRTLNLVTFGILISLGGVQPLLAFSIGSAVAAVASNVFAKYFVKKRLPSPGELRLRSAVGQSWPFWLSSVSSQARNADTAITALLAGATQAGLYGAASRLTGPLRLFATSLASLLLPAASRRSGPDLIRLVRAIGAVIVLSSLGYGLIALLVPALLPIALGDAYKGSIASIQIILIGLVFASASALVEAVLQGINKERYVATVSTLTSLIALSGVAVGASMYGATGAAVGLSIAFVLQAILLGFGLLVGLRGAPADKSVRKG